MARISVFVSIIADSGEKFGNCTAIAADKSYPPVRDAHAGKTRHGYRDATGQ